MVCRNSLFLVSLAAVIGAGSAFAQGTCNLVGSTITCTGGQGAHVVQTGLAAVPNTTAADHFPTTISVPSNIASGKTVSSVSVTLNGYTSVVNAGLTIPQRSSVDVGILLASPTGRNLEIMRSVGRGSVAQNNLTITLQDGALALPSASSNTSFSSGTFAPSSYPDPITTATSPNYSAVGGPTILHKAQTNGTSTLNSTNGVFTGDQADGIWQLYLADDSNANIQFSSWSLTLTVAVASTPSTTTLTSNPTTAYTSSPNNSVTLSAAITAGATGNVTFKDGATNLSCTEGAQPRPVASNSATCTTSFSTEGVHALSANYSGDGTFVASSGTANVFIQNHATNVGTTYCNTGSIANPTGRSDLLYSNTVPYPSVIFIGDGVNADLASSVNTASVTLKNLSSATSNAVRFLLMAPDGTHAFAFWADAGAGAATTGDYTIMDGAPQLPQASGLVPGTYGPTDYSVNPDTFSPGPPAPAPQVPPSFSIPAPKGSQTFNTSLAGAAAHGAWSLFMFSDGGGFSSTTVGGGWCLNITPGTGNITTTSVNANPVQAAKGASVTFTATITSSPAVGNTGTVTFTENGNILTGAPNSGVANVVGGAASIATSALSEGDHTITASYHDAGATYNDSFNSVTIRVDAATAIPTLSGSIWSYCNTSAIVIPAGQFAVNDFGPAQPNPSNIFVANLPGTILSVGLTLKGFHVTSPQNLESLLVGPNGGAAPTIAQTLDFFSFTGGGVPFGPQDTTFNDSGSLVSASSAPGAVNAPTSRGATSYTPSAFYNLPGTFQFAAPQGNFTFNTGINGVFPNKDPNGTWSVYFDQNIHHTNDGANGGWCMNFIENPVTVGVTASHVGHPDGHFMQGELGALLNVAIHNNGDANGKGSTGDPDNLHPLTVVDVLPANLDYTPGTLPTGSPWSCAAVGQTVTCVSHNAVAAGGNYPTLTIPVNVANAARTSDNNSVSVSGGGVTTTTSNTDNIIIDPAPVLSIAKSHSVTFKQGQTAVWNLQVTNNAATTFGATDGTTVTVSDTLPTGYTMASFTGTNWNCTGNNVVTCTTTDKIAGAGGSFNPIALTVNVPENSPTSVSNTAKVYGGGDLVHVDANSGATGSDSVNNVVQVPASVSAAANTTPQSAMVGTPFAQNLSVTVKDANNVGVANVSVTFTAPSTGVTGTFPGNTNTAMISTNASGVATAPQFTANFYSGTYAVAAAIPGFSTSFNLTNTASGGPGGAPTADMVTGFTTGSLNQTLTLKASSPNGAAYLQYVAVMLSAPLLSSGECAVVYDRETNGFYLWSDGTAAMQGPAAPGANSTASNGECTFNAAGSSVTMSPTQLTVSNVNIVLNSSYGSSQNIYLYANDNANQNSGWVYMATTAPFPSTPPTSDGVTGGVVDSLTQTLTFTYSSPNGYLWLNDVYAAMGPVLSASNSCVVFYDRPTGAFYLLNDAGTGTSAALVPGSAGSVNNSQCTLAGTGSTVSGSGNMLTVVLKLTFSASFGGGQNIFMYAYDRNGMASGWQSRGSTISSAPPMADSFSGFVTANQDNQTLTFQYSSVNGAGYIEDTYVLLNGGFSAASGCIVLWNRPGNAFYLMNDMGTAFTGPLTATNLSNSQCTLKFAGTQTAAPAAALNMTLNLTFNPAFSGVKQVWMYAYDAAGNASGWVNNGMFTLP